MTQRQVLLGDTNREVGKSGIGVGGELLVGGCRVLDTVGTIDLGGDRVDLFLEARLVWVEDLELRFFLGRFLDGLGQIGGAAATVGEVG